MGAAWLLHNLWSELGFCAAIGKATSGRRLDARVERVLLAVVANRALNPASMRAALEWAAHDVLPPGLGASPPGPRVRVSECKLPGSGYPRSPATGFELSTRAMSGLLTSPTTRPADCRTQNYLSETDDFTKHALAIQVKLSKTGDDIFAVLEGLIMIHGVPGFLCMDNSTAMTLSADADWCRFSLIGIVFIDPGSPLQNAHVESFTDRLRDELLAVEVFHTLLGAEMMSEDYRRHYNAYRPHSSLGYLAPDEFARYWNIINPGLTKCLAHQPRAGHSLQRRCAAPHQRLNRESQQDAGGGPSIPHGIPVMDGRALVSSRELGVHQ